MEEVKQTLMHDLRALQAEIDALLSDESNPFDTLPDKVDTHNQLLAKLFSCYQEEDIDEPTMNFLKATQSKISHWTEQAIEERDETRQNLLKLAKGRKARSQY